MRAIYKHEMPSDEDHEALHAALSDCAAHVVLSGYHSPLYDGLYGEWDRLEVNAIANHNGNVDADPRRTEVLWSNRPMSRQQSFEETEVAA